jgi:hypothetical protein
LPLQNFLKTPTQIKYTGLKKYSPNNISKIFANISTHIPKQTPFYAVLGI